MSIALHLPASCGGTTIRVMRRDDVCAFAAYRSDPVLAQYQGWSPMTQAESLNFVDLMATACSLEPGQWIQLAISQSSTDDLVGDLGLCLAADSAAVEIGFTVANEHQGQGHATRAVVLAAQLCRPFAPMLRAVTDARNQASMAVLERSGFQKHSERKAFFKGESCIEYIYLRPSSEPMSRPV